MHPNKNIPNNKIPKRITLTNASTSPTVKNNVMTSSKFQNDKKMMSSSVGSPITNIGAMTSSDDEKTTKLTTEKRTMSSSEGMSLNINDSNSTNQICDFGSTDSKPSAPLELDLTVSRFGIVSNEALIYKVELSQINERKLVQNMLKELRFVLEFDIDVLEEQKYFWLSFISIISQEQRNRIKSTLENYCRTPVTWLSNNEIEININPEYRIVKQRVV